MCLLDLAHIFRRLPQCGLTIVGRVLQFPRWKNSTNSASVNIKTTSDIGDFVLLLWHSCYYYGCWLLSYIFNLISMLQVFSDSSVHFTIKDLFLDWLILYNHSFWGHHLIGYSSSNVSSNFIWNKIKKPHCIF